MRCNIFEAHRQQSETRLWPNCRNCFTLSATFPLASFYRLTLSSSWPIFSGSATRIAPLDHGFLHLRIGSKR